MCQKVINVLAVASFAVSGAVVGTAGYVFVNKDAILDGVSQKVLGGLGGFGGSTLPTGSNDLGGSAAAGAGPVGTPSMAAPF